MSFFIHESSIIDEGSKVGEGSKIWHFCHILPSSLIGKNCNIGQNCVIGPKVTIGDNVKIQNNVSLYEGVICEDDVFIGPSVVFTNVLNPRSFISRKHEYKQTLLEKGSSLGANSTIVCGVSIGKYALVGAGSVVTKNIPPHALVVGNPARIVGWVDKAGIKMNFVNGVATDSYDGTSYRLEELQK